MAVESYAHVHHIVSNIRGRLRDDVSPGELIRAMFPGGTITGCPKVRCMEIISELESVPRGPYTGSMGYLNRDGSCDLNILIRSFVLHGQRAVLRGRQRHRCRFRSGPGTRGNPREGQGPAAGPGGLGRHGALVDQWRTRPRD